MKIKDLKKVIQDMPDDLEVIMALHHLHSIKDIYNITGCEIRKAKIKLIKEVGGHIMIQSRPKKNENATLALILE